MGVAKQKKAAARNCSFSFGNIIFQAFDIGSAHENFAAYANDRNRKPVLAYLVVNGTDSLAGFDGKLVDGEQFFNFIGIHLIIIPQGFLGARTPFAGFMIEGFKFF